MTNSKNARQTAGFSDKAAGRLSMISILAISAGLAAAPAQAQTVIEPSDMPMQSPVASPEPVQQPAPVTVTPSTGAETTPMVSPDRADALATDGGFDAATVAPEALAQIEAEKQARKAAAEKAEQSAAAVRTAAAERSAALARNSNAPATVTPTPDMTAAPAASMLATADPAPVTASDTAPAGIEPAPVTTDPAVAAGDLPADSEWTLLAALAGLLGLGGMGAFVASRRRKSKVQATAPEYAAQRSERETAAVAAATMPELRRDPVETAAGSGAQSTTAAIDFKGFVAGQPSFEEPRSRADHNIPLGQRRVAAAPRPYLSEVDLARSPGYFTTHVDAIPTPQNPFLTRQRRLKRARHLDARLAEMKENQAMRPDRISGAMLGARSPEPVFS
tara:strand:+ start:4155 stop:5327 length:1173 start_codon:yes stop_codon:yes gene_type:complete